MKPRYIVEVWPHGWLLCGADGCAVPLTALSECEKLFPKTAVMAMDIPHHYKTSGRPNVVMCIVDAGAKHNAWRTEILASVAHLPPEERWWRGLDVGMSAAAIFGVLASNRVLADAAKHEARSATPADSSDFGRCMRLVSLFGWRERLALVAEAYPGTRWPLITPRWDEIAALPDSEKSKLLAQL